MENTYTKVRRNGVESELLTEVIKNLGKDKIEKLGWEILPSEPLEVLELKKLKTSQPPTVSTEPIEEEVVVKEMKPEGGVKEKRAYNKKK